MSENVKVVSRGGAGFWSLLAIVLIALKLTGQAQISWWVIVGCLFAPIIIIITIMGLVLGCAAIMALIVAILDSIKTKGR